MSKPINNDIAYKGSTLILAIKFPEVDGTSFYEFVSENSIKVRYFIVNTNKKVDVPLSSLFHPLDEDDEDYYNVFAFAVDTSELIPGVLMVEIKLKVPANGNIPERIEIARCSTGIAIVE